MNLLSITTSIFLALRFLRGRGRVLSSTVTVLSIVGVSLGVMVPIVVLSVMSGFQAEIKTKILGMNGHINVVAPTAAGFNKNPNIVETLNQDKRIITAYPYGETRGVLEVRGIFEPVLIRAYDEKVFENDQELAKMLKIKSGEKKIERRYQVMIGTGLADSHLLSKDDRANLILFQSKQLNFNAPNKTKTLRTQVTGIFKSGFQEYDNSIVITSLKTLQGAFEDQKDYDAINIKLKDIWESENVKEDLIESFGDRYLIYSWQELNQNFFRALSLEKTLMYLIMSFILLVALFNVTSYQLIQVVERKKEIGILKTLGFSSFSIAGIFLSSGLIISLIGSLIGASLGVLISLNIETSIAIVENIINAFLFIISFFLSFFSEITISRFEIFPSKIYYLDGVPSDVSFLQVSMFILMAIFFSFLAGLWPSIKAAKMKPMEIMRYE